jgi:aryl-alcohol dehydrogenase-like predicted oxidoreductase
MRMTTRVSCLTLNNGIELPALGLGVFQSPQAETVTAVESALATGYRLIDTAAAYANEREVGQGIRRSGVPRDEVFIETKVWTGTVGERPGRGGRCGRSPPERREAPTATSALAPAQRYGGQCPKGAPMLLTLQTSPPSVTT